MTTYLEVGMARQLLTMAEVQAEFGFPLDTLRYWRARGDGPLSFRLGRRVMYDRADLDAWITREKQRARVAQAA
jgi:predicted DNA-binding transcriptional regulator AlpA